MEELFSNNKPSQSAQKLIEAGIKTLADLLWLLPSRIESLPSLRHFDTIEPDAFFKGAGKILSLKSRPNFRARGKSRIPLVNISVIVKDHFSEKYLNLNWFNSYHSVYKKLAEANHIIFLGKIHTHNDQLQINNPEFDLFDPEHIPTDQDEKQSRVIYPTVNKVSDPNIKKVFERIPAELWNQIPEAIPEDILKYRQLMNLTEAFNTLHAKNGVLRNEEKERQARERLAYEEFFKEQLKIRLRRDQVKKEIAPAIEISEHEYQSLLTIFPYKLTEDQLSCMDEIRKDLATGNPMMRLIQGDVGCGKTSIAVLTALLNIKNKKQAALMCPTESLALQHYENISEYLKYMPEIKIALLIGGQKESLKKKIQEDIKDGVVNFIIGTHALFQKSVEFQDLGLVIIDEQHKFGVEQRIQLTQKANGVHCLIMSATPIPRSLSLTRYGDLDISTIRTLPASRAGQKTRIVTPANFEHFLGFLNTRLNMGEQAYLVVPAINESEMQDLLNLEKVLERFKQFFPKMRVEGLHGQMKSDEKANILSQYVNHKINILVATSVIEVGINVLNATIMAIMNPERFGLSSLHQLRGRVGRGKKQGFCFLICDRGLSQSSLERLKIIEQYNDGFKIAEEDLRIRGEGDLFGKNQSGDQDLRKVADPFKHMNLLKMAREDINKMFEFPSNLASQKLIDQILQDTKVFTTI